MPELHPERYEYDHDKQASINPTEHEGLVHALTTLWESEVGHNLQLLALGAGVDAALQVAMGAAVVFVLANEDYERWATKTSSGLVVVGEGQDEGIRKLHDSMEKLRGGG